MTSEDRLLRSRDGSEVPDDPFKALREGIADGSIAVWCPCYGTPEPGGSWVAPDDEHADTHVIDWLQENGRRYEPSAGCNGS